MTTLITGGTRGIGLATATTLAAQGRHVTITGRDTTAAQAAVQAIRRQAGPAAQVQPLALDLASLADVRRCARQLHERSVELDGVVLNAGVNTTGVQSTTDGFELAFAVNHLGHYLLLHRLLTLLRPAARVVFVSSGVHDPDTLDGRPAPPTADAAAQLADPDTAPRRGQVRYSTSKLANLMTAYEFSRRLHSAALSTPHPSVTVNAFDPGAVPGTGLTREWSLSARAAVRMMGVLRFLPVNVYAVTTSAAALARLVTDPDLTGVSGRYFGVRGPKASSLDSHDQRRSHDLFQDSATLVNLLPHESPLAPTTTANL